MHPIFLTSPIITAIIGLLVVFAACEQSHAALLSPSTNRLQQPPSPTPLPSTVPTTCSESQRARIHLQFLLSNTKKRGCSLQRGVPKTILVLADCSCFRRLLHSVPVLQKLQASFSLCLWVAAAGKSSAQPSATFFSAFFCGWKTYLPGCGRVGRICPVALSLLEKSHGDVGTPDTSWHAPSSSVLLNLTCQVPANKQVQAQVMPLRAVAPGTRHSACQHFSAGVLNRLLLMK